MSRLTDFLVAKELLNTEDSVLIVTIDEKEYLRLVAPPPIGCATPLPRIRRTRGMTFASFKKTCDMHPLRPPRFISMRRMTCATRRRRKGAADDAYIAQPFPKQGQSRLSMARDKQ